MEHDYLKEAKGLFEQFARMSPTDTTLANVMALGAIAGALISIAQDSRSHNETQEVSDEQSN